jgi:hypothetical protein
MRHLLLSHSLVILSRRLGGEGSVHSLAAPMLAGRQQILQPAKNAGFRMTTLTKVAIPTPEV